MVSETDRITSFGKRLESYLGHTLNFCPNLVQYRFQNMYLKKSLTRSLLWSCLQTKDGQRQTNFISSGSKIVKRLRHRQYDPVIIDGTIGLVFCPSTALCRSFLMVCTLNNMAVWTIWRALSKPPQRRQGHDSRPLWLLVGTPSAFWPELA